ncbi:dTDP-4-amino-4,6-dideoxygalactose transaminase [Catenuloplanes nepalensis]|uniref:dTDP-4-amino-4,6-dideoxygalactose transaminase n=1 Tax=Catenuloplanes nepalensis TaxID=587533 RepID=A0ABT9MWQ2_9ACTN|nr:DegT/DnrJ/EryC1/StrS family aminotransferase [Catenuloplanes nepalensis]MDP9795663.1 dTDP-4-amino-4,6-dideoxygalactose transaminase [Catenuloplanes nepalensis]
MTIPLVDLKASYERHKAGIDAAIAEVITNTRFIGGKELVEFEAAFAEFCNARFAIGVGSGTAALHLALAALEVGPGDIVAVPAHTFIATAEPVVWLGATPRFVDIEPETGCMDPAALKAALAPGDVKAVIPVHIHGQPVDLAAIGAIAEEAGVPIIEDAAQAHGSSVTLADGSVVRAGSYGAISCFSFYPGKNLGAFGDAGALTTNDPELAQKLKKLRDHGRLSKYEHDIVGYAHRLDTIQAAILGVKLTTLDADNDRRREIAAGYRAGLEGVGDLRFVTEAPGRRSVYHHFVLHTADRDALLAHLKAAGIGAGIHFPLPLHLQPAFAYLGGKRGDLPNTEAFESTCVSLPIYPELTDAQRDEVIAAVRSYFDGN